MLSHARALLASGPGGACDYIETDLRDTGVIIKGAAGILDFTRPVAVLLNAIMHFIPDNDDPWGISSRLMAAVPAGGYLVLSHATGEQITIEAYREKLNEAYAAPRPAGSPPARSPMSRNSSADWNS